MSNRNGEVAEALNQRAQLMLARNWVRFECDPKEGVMLEYGSILSDGSHERMIARRRFYTRLDGEVSFNIITYP